MHSNPSGHRHSNCQWYSVNSLVTRSESRPYLHPLRQFVRVIYKTIARCVLNPLTSASSSRILFCTEMTKSDWIRLWMHVPWGILGALLFIPNPLLGLTACLSMFVYEAFNDWRKKDESYKDVLGIVWGFFIGGILIWGFKL